MRHFDCPEKYRPAYVDDLPFDPGHILVYGRSSHGAWHAGLFSISLATADRTVVYGNDPDTGGRAADGAGDIRYRLRQVGDRTIHEVRRDKTSRWEPLVEYRDLPLGLDPVHFWGFSADNQGLYLTRPDQQGRDCLYRVDLARLEWGDPLFCPEQGEIENVRLSWDHARVESVRYGPDGRQEKWFDPDLARVAALLRVTIPPESEFTIASADRSNHVFTVRVYGARNPGEYYLLDLRGRTQFVRLGRKHPGIPVDQLCPMMPITYRARDGLMIHGYLTRPQDSAGRRVPLIILPHGGPYGIRDVWGFDAEVQFLANRGYAVLQPNYRGSGGYGEAFLLAGRHEWGGKMQDDLTDAVAWAVEQGIADPARICIYGASYGGYAALAGVVFTPDLYCCAVNYAGVTDLDRIANWQNEMSAGGRTYCQRLIGDDKEYLESHSPVNFVSRIKVPTLHACGENDPRVDIKNWKALERELKKYGRTYEYVREANEGHGFQAERARIRFYEQLEAFLERYLRPGGTPAPASAP